jgi:hypothetical protein
MVLGLPIVEIADDADTLRIRRPHGEPHPSSARLSDAVCPHLCVQPRMRPLFEQVDIVIRESAVIPAVRGDFFPRFLHVFVTRVGSGSAAVRVARGAERVRHVSALELHRIGFCE